MSGHVAVVLPGANYGPDLPALAIPIDVLQKARAKVITVEYPGGMWPDWRRAESGDWSEVHEALAPQVVPVVKGASRVTVVAKSMGTSVFPFLMPLIDAPTTAIWITPLFHMADVRANAIATGWRCLSVFGTADSAHDAAGQTQVTSACDGVELAIERATHALTVSDDDAATKAGYDALGAAVKEFVA